MNRQLLRTRVFASALSVCLFLFCKADLWAQATTADAQDGINRLRGILILGDVTRVRTNEMREITHVVVEGPDFLRKHEAALNTLLQKYFGRDIESAEVVEWLPEMLQTLNSFCRTNGRPVVDSFFPSLTMSGAGRIQVVVFEGRLGKVNTEVHRRNILTDSTRLTANQAPRLAAKLELKPNYPIEGPALLHGLQKLNALPEYQQADVSLQKGKLLGQSDVNLSVTNRFPIEPFVGYANSGNTLIGLDQASAGFFWYDPLGVADRFAAQFTASANAWDFWAASASYDIPLWPRDHLLLYGGYADFNTDLGSVSSSLSTLGQSGHNIIAGLRFTHGFPDSAPSAPGGEARYRHEAFLGFDYKNIQSTLQFSANDIIPSADFEVAEFVFGYRGTLVDKFGKTYFQLQGFYNPGGLVSGNNSQAYNEVSPGAATSYVYGRFDLRRETPIVKEWLFWDLNGQFQYSDKALVPSERFQMGGADTVRGFEQGVMLDDSAIVVRNELGFEIPSLSHKMNWGGPGSARLVGFFDYGLNYLSGAGDSPQNGFSMGSVGGGLRLRWGRHLEVVAEYGFQILGENAELVGGSGAKNVDGLANLYVRLRF